MTGLWRAPAPSERVHADKEAYIGYVVRAAGRLDTDALSAAFAALCGAHPQLTARLGTSEHGPVYTESDVRPELQVSDGDLDRPLTGVKLDQQRSLCALNVVRDGDEASVCLLTHHGIADAHHSVDLLATLWSCYTDVVRGVPVDLPRRPFPRSLEDLLAERSIHGPATDPARASRPVTLPDQDAPPRHVVQHRLTAAETTALAELCHREHVTINGVLAGTLLLVEAELRDVALTDLIHRYTVNLRNHLTPPVGATEGTNVLGGAGFKATGETEADPVAIGRAISEQRRAGLADGSIQRSILDLLAGPAPGAKPWDPSTAPAVVSMINWGVLPTLRTPDGLRLTNFHSTSSMREVLSLGGYVVNTFDGRIGIDLAWPDGDPQLPRRLDCLREGLSRTLS
jgi:acetyltransferase